MTDAILAELSALRGGGTPAVREVRRRFSRALAAEPPTVVLAIVRGLLEARSWMTRVVAYELLAGHRAAMGRLNGPAIDRLAQGLDDWGSIDLFGVTVSGVAWREGSVSDAHVMRWTRSPDRWRRRLALVSTVPLNSRARGGSGDVTRTLAVCRALADDRDDMVVKALSWALRELSKRDPRAVKAFLASEDERLAARVRREVRNKLQTGRKSGRPARGNGG